MSEQYNFSKHKLKKLSPREFTINESLLSSDLIREILSVYSRDLGRSLLENEGFRLMEKLSYLSENNNIETIGSSIELTHLDKVFLSFSYQSYIKSMEDIHSGDYAILTPPMSFTLPLLISYHLIMHHISCSIQPSSNNNIKFANNSGILIITDNFELLSRIYRTTVSNVYLKDFINTYTLRSDEFKRMRSQEEKMIKRSSKDKYKEDGTLPWICLFRAAHHELPAHLDKVPQVIILDMLPSRHRKRIEELIEWGKSNSKHLIVTAPLYDTHILSSLKKKDIHIFQLDKFTSKTIGRSLLNDNKLNLTSQLTDCWTLKASMPYISDARTKCTIYKINNIYGFNERVFELFKLLKFTYCKDGSQPKSFKRLTSILFDLLGLPLPLDWYERNRLVNNKIKSRDLINSCLRIPGATAEEENILKGLLAKSVNLINEIYDLLYVNQSPRGEILCSLIQNNLNLNITIIVSNKIAADELKIWLRFKLNLKSKELSKLKIHTQSEWAKSQIKLVVENRNERPDIVILTNPWLDRYLSSFYIFPETQLYFICLGYEYKLIEQQINMVFTHNEDSVNELLACFASAFKFESNKIENKFKSLIDLDFENINIKFETPNNEMFKLNDYSSSNATSLGILFNDDVLFSMINTAEIEENSQFLEDDDFSQFSINLSNNDDLQRCIRIKGIYSKDDSSMNFLYPNNFNLRVIQRGISEIISAKPLQLNMGDCIIKARKNERKEIFDSILDIASNTMTMQWINMNVKEWHEMTRILWDKHYDSNLPKRVVYERIINGIKVNGGQIETAYTIRNWINGDVSSVRDERNVLAVAKLIDDNYYLERAKVIHRAMRQLWDIHIKLGKKLGTILQQYASKKNNDLGLLPEWVELGMDIRIPVQDLLNAIDIIEVESVEKDTDYIVDQRFVEIPISDNVLHTLIERGLVKNE
jgi:hypothetical protein